MFQRSSTVLLAFVLGACEHIASAPPQADESSPSTDGSIASGAQPNSGASAGVGGRAASRAAAPTVACMSGQGDCCSTAADCPASYSWSARCDDLATCQGTRGEASCAGGVCGTTMIEDDSACEGTTDCGMLAPVVCTRGTPDQTKRGCATNCSADEDCVTDAAYCGSGECVPRLDDGEQCDRDTQCKNGCGTNGICCDGEECCVTASDCTPDPGTCTESCAGGKRKVRVCSSNTCVTRPNAVDDDSACAAMKFDCGYYNPGACTTDVEQMGCPTSCMGSNECDPGNVCVSETVGATIGQCRRPIGAAGSSGAGSGGARG